MNLMNQVSRSLLRQGNIFMDDCPVAWSETWHETESTVFASKSFECDQCNKPIECGDLMSLGKRYFDPDASFTVSGVDRIHLQCTNKDTTLEVQLQVKQISDITEIAGWAALTPEQKNKWLKATGKEVTQELLNKKQVFMGVQCLISGEFDNKWQLERTLTEGGATINKNVIKALTHLIVGRTGRSEYGQTTGPGSKKFKEAKKIKGIVVLTEEQVHDAVKQFEMDHIALMERSDIGKPAVAPKRVAAPQKQMIFSDDVEEEEKKEEKEQQQAGADADADAEETNNKKGKVKKAPANTKRKADLEPEPEPEVEVESEEPAAKKAKKNPSKTQHTSSSLAALSRKQLQSLAKKSGLKASASSAQLIQQILDAQQCLEQ